MIVFGLGNPLAQYKNNRHNAGFMVTDRMAKRLEVGFKQYEHFAVSPMKDNLILVKPMLYMNNSGAAVTEAFQVLGQTDDFVVVYDDWSLPLGKVRIRAKGSDGGHNGMASVIYHLNTDKFARIRVGIGPLPDELSATDFVLGDFTKKEKKILDQVLDMCCVAIEVIREYGIQTAMNRYNSIDRSLETENK